jgi:hypothetical protein
LRFIFLIANFKLNFFGRMKINVIQGKYVDENLFLSISNLFALLFTKSSMVFEFYTSDLKFENFENDDQRDLILKKIKLEEEIESNGQGQSFEYFFEEIHRCRNYTYHINKDELVIYLTGEKNERNFFGWINEEMKSCFINTSIWKQIYNKDVDIIYPISYEILGWLLRSLMFDNSNDLYKNAHFNETTCFMDFCENIKKHEIKTKTGEICNDCIDRINSKGISNLLVKEVYASFEKIRGYILNREIYVTKPTIKIHKYRNDNIQFIIPEYGDLIIPFEPRQKTIYWFFLKNEKDILLKSIKKYRDEILGIHSTVNVRYTDEKVIESVDKMLGLSNDKVYNGKNEISSVKSKINGRLKEIIPSKLINNYIIQGERMMPNRVILDRRYFQDLLG